MQLGKKTVNQRKKQKHWKKELKKEKQIPWANFQLEAISSGSQSTARIKFLLSYELKSVNINILKQRCNDSKFNKSNRSEIENLQIQ